MWIKSKVVMLPTNEKAILGLNSVHNHLFFATGMAEIPSQSYQNLYFLSDEEIKKGDWYVNTLTGTLHKQSAMMYSAPQLKKIIATTDNSLKIKKFEKGVFKELEYSLPKPSKEFLEVFVDQYNKKNKTEEVMIAYAKAFTAIVDKDIEIKDEGYILYVKSDNTITIKKIKDSWTKEEVKILCEEFFYKGESYGQAKTNNPDYYKFGDSLLKKLLEEI